MPAKNYLKIGQKQKLQKALKEEENPEIRERILILLLLNDGKTQAEISSFLGCGTKKVSYWCVHGDPENLETLKDKRMEGNHRKATEEYIKFLLEIIEKKPEELGYEFGRWTAKRLATYLEKETGISLSSSQIRRILERKKYVYLWSKYSLEEKWDRQKRKAFKEKLKEYLKITQESPERLQVWFWDESGFSLRVIRRKNWCLKGTRKKLRGDRRKGRVNVMGCLRYSDKKRWVEFIEKGDGENFYQVMKCFYQEVIKEWVEAGNHVKDFREKGAKIVIILDNASFHKQEEILKKIEEEMPNIHLEFLPEYSPDYNLIELVWHSSKEYIANRLFTSIEELEYLLHRLLNEGELIIKWERKLKNKGNSVKVV
ncbi:MAG: IS630 family transposase [Hydrococcus sp. Prado102]|jgi:transposase|nr:IS630 family transposase [Hydrococcus sp. Prado102]